MSRRRTACAALAGLAAASSAGLGLASCAGLPWGQGAQEPTRATAGALIRTVDADVLAQASDELAAGLAARWPEGLRLETATSADIDWSGWTLTPGSPRLELSPARPVQQSESSAPVVVVHLPIAASLHGVTLSIPGADTRCTVAVELAAGELAVPMSFVADKLGRVQGVVLADAGYYASDFAPHAFLDASFSTCAGLADDSALLASLSDSFSAAAVHAVADGLSAELPAALGLDLALGWSGSVAADALGTGFLRVALRGLENGLVRREDAAFQIAYAFTVEATAHPCMDGLELPEPRPELPVTALAAGSALHIESLERIVGAAWLGGVACADHLGRIPLDRDELAAAWPALARLEPGAEVSLELWPAALPRLLADTTMVDGLALETGRMRVDLIVTFGDARWRAASVDLDLNVHGSLWVEPGGDLRLDPAAIEALPTTFEAGLLPAPEAALVDALLAPLIEALVLDRPLARLPPALAPTVAGPVRVEGAYLAWQAITGAP